MKILFYLVLCSAFFPLAAFAEVKTLNCFFSKGTLNKSFQMKTETLVELNVPPRYEAHALVPFNDTTYKIDVTLFGSAENEALLNGASMYLEEKVSEGANQPRWAQSSSALFARVTSPGLAPPLSISSTRITFLSNGAEVTLRLSCSL